MAFASRLSTTNLCFNTGLLDQFGMERGNHHIRAYLSFIQHKTPRIVCNLDVTIFLNDLTSKLD